MEYMTVRVEVKVDGRVVRVEETQIEKTDDTRQTTGVINFLHRARKMLENLVPADLLY